MEADDIPVDLVANIQTTLAEIAGPFVSSSDVKVVRVSVNGYLKIDLEVQTSTYEVAEEFMRAMLCCTTSLFGKIEYFSEIGSVVLFFIKSNLEDSFTSSDPWRYPPGPKEPAFWEEGWFWGMIVGIFCLVCCIFGCISLVLYRYVFNQKTQHSESAIWTSGSYPLFGKVTKLTSSESAEEKDQYVQKPFKGIPLPEVALYSGSVMVSSVIQEKQLLKAKNRKSGDESSSDNEDQ